MNKFRDAAGQTWIINLTYRKVKVVHGFGVALLDLGNASGNGLPSLANDRILLAEVLYRVCVPEDSWGDAVHDTFIGALDGEAIENGFAAIAAALIEFFPVPDTSVIEDAGTEVAEPISPTKIVEHMLRMAGVVGVDPNPFSFRELYDMYRSRQEHNWQMASSILAMIVNAAPFRKGEPVSPDEFNPMVMSKRLSRMRQIAKDAKSRRLPKVIPPKKIKFQKLKENADGQAETREAVS